MSLFPWRRPAAPTVIYPRTPKGVLPAWLRRQPSGVYVVDPNIAYPTILSALGVTVVDQYWLEVAYQVAKQHVQKIAAESGHAGTLHIVIEGGPERKKKWAQTYHKPGRGAGYATRRHEARDHYARIAHRL